jgi:hypothetical protein
MVRAQNTLTIDEALLVQADGVAQAAGSLVGLGEVITGS